MTTLYRGDALAVLRDLPDASVDAVITDPPYKISQEYSANADPDNLLAVATLWPAALEMFRATKPGGFCVMFYDTRILPFALRVMSDAGWKYLRALTFYRRWGQANKLSGWMSTSDFILVFVKPGAAYEFSGEWRHDVYVKDRAEVVSYGHPAQKPLDAVRHIVRNVTRPGAVVLDPFMGSGTMGTAAVLEGRDFIGVELAEHHYRVAEERIRSTERGYRPPPSQLVLGEETA